MPRIRRILRAVHLTILAVAATTLAVVNARLYSSASPTDPTGVEAALRPQLRFVGDELRAGAGTRMQAWFPEGYFFAHALYGLTWVELAEAQPANDQLRGRALAESTWAAGRLDSAEGVAPFDASLTPRYGVFHAGWSLRLRGAVLRLTPPAERDAAAVARYAADCDALAAAFAAAAETPFLCAYPGQSWPCDSVVAAAALRLHDSFLPGRFGPVLRRWEADARERLDHATGLLPHRADPRTGRPVEGARGSSQSVIQRFLPEVSPAWAAGQYGAFRRQFVDTPMGLPGVREYPRGEDGPGDVDSGPLVAGVSMSATVVAYGTARAHGDDALAGPVSQVMEAAGMPVAWAGTKRYALGTVPVGDAFIAWSKAARPIVATGSVGQAPQWPPVGGRWWRVPTHSASAIALLVLASPIFVNQWRRRRRRRGSDEAGTIASNASVRSGE